MIVRNQVVSSSAVSCKRSWDQQDHTRNQSSMRRQHKQRGPATYSAPALNSFVEQSFAHSDVVGQRGGGIAAAGPTSRVHQEPQITGKVMGYSPRHILPPIAKT